MSMIETDTRQLLDAAYAAFERGEALPAHQLASRAVAAAPESFEAQSFAATAALSAGEPHVALDHFAAALKLAPSLQAQAACWLGSGRAWLGLDEAKRAHKAFRRGISLAPGLPPLLSGLAAALLELGRYREAEDAARKALAGNPQDGHAQVVLGAALMKQDRLAEAIGLLEWLREDPQAGAEARHYLAMSRMVAGDLEGALTELRSLIDENPHSAVYTQLAQSVSFASREDPDFLRLASREREIEKIQGPARMDLMFALAKAYDDLEDLERAGYYLREGNALEQARRPYDPAADEALMARIAKLFTTDFVSRHSEFGIVGIQPVFVISLPRSGSTLIEQMIAAHSKVRGGGEMGHLSQIATGLSLKWGAREDFPNISSEDAASDLRQAAAQYKDRTAHLTLLHSRFTDKSLQNFLYVGLIRMLLPEAHIVHIRRHPLATAFGLYRQRFERGMRYSYDLEAIARYYRAYARLMRHWRETLPGTFIELRYEELVKDPEHQLRRVFDYLGLEFEPACLEFYRLRRPVHTASQTQVRRRLDPERLDHYKRYGELLAPVARALRDEINDYEAAP